MSIQTIYQQTPQHLQIFEQIEQATIAVDWFQIYGKFNKCIDEDVLIWCKENFECLYYGDNKELVLKHRGTSAGMYAHNFDVYLYGELVANFCVYPTLTAKNEMSLPKDACSLKIENHLLYTSDWMIIFELICEKLQIIVNNVSRLDIAIDNTQNIKDFMGFYVSRLEKKLKRAGKSPKQHENGAVNGIRFDEDGGYASFKIGSSKSDKYITIYNKTSEIQSKSNKKYIIDFWKNTGIDTDKTIYRTEIRLNSKALQTIKNFEIDKLDDKKYLASIFKTQAENFFEFFYACDTNSTRCPRIKIIDYDNLGAELLTKAIKEPPKDVYKAKLTLHLLYKLIFQNRINVADYEAEIANLSQKIRYDFDLEDWLTISKEKWRKKYKVNLYQLVEIYAKKECIRLNLSLQSLYNQKHTPEIDFQVCKSYGFDGSFDLFLQYWNKITLN